MHGRFEAETCASAGLEKQGCKDFTFEHVRRLGGDGLHGFAYGEKVVDLFTGEVFDRDYVSSLEPQACALNAKDDWLLVINVCYA